MRLFFLLLLSLTAAGSIRAAVVGIVPGNPPRTVLSISGAFLNSDAWVRVGFFRNLVTGDLQCPGGGTGAIMDAINQNFVPLGEAISPPGYGTAANNSISYNAATGSISGAVTDVNISIGTPNAQESGFVPRGTRLFILVYDQAGLGVFSATANSWLIPVIPTLNTSVLALPQVDSPDEVFRGMLGSPGSLVLLPFCPEPGSAALLLLAGAGLASRRR